MRARGQWWSIWISQPTLSILEMVSLLRNKVPRLKLSTMCVIPGTISKYRPKDRCRQKCMRLSRNPRSGGGARSPSSFTVNRPEIHEPSNFRTDRSNLVSIFVAFLCACANGYDGKHHYPYICLLLQKFSC